MLVLGPKDVQEGGAAVRGDRQAGSDPRRGRRLALSLTLSAMELGGAGVSPDAGWGTLAGMIGERQVR